MTRFFMTIPEASSLVVQAGAMGGRGQVYVLDMGEPVRILDLAKQMIRLSGRREEDIPIVFTGSRAGEKVHEVLWNEGEAVGPTSHPKIMRAARPQIDAAWLAEALAELERLVDDGRRARRRREARLDVRRAAAHGPCAGSGRHVALTSQLLAGSAGTVARWTSSTA